jgi:hypothetical protein
MVLTIASIDLAIAQIVQTNASIALAIASLVLAIA